MRDMKMSKRFGITGQCSVVLSALVAGRESMINPPHPVSFRTVAKARRSRRKKVGFCNR
jgi:hypothetical protein